MTPRPRARHALLWITVAAGGLIGLTVLLSTVSGAAHDTPFIESPGALIGTIILGLTGLASAVLPPLLRAEASGEVIKRNVQNGHSAPLRDDLDALTAAIKVIGAAVDRIQETAAGTASDIRGIRRDVGRNADATIATGKMLSEHERRLDAAAERLGEVEQLQSVLIQRQRDQY